MAINVKVLGAFVKNWIGIDVQHALIVVVKYRWTRASDVQI